MIDPTIRIVLIVLTVLVALGVGILLRRKLIERLKKTVLDKWIIQTLGVLVIVPPLVVGALLIPIIYSWSTDLFYSLWGSFAKAFNVRDASGLAWNLVQTALLIALGMGVARTIRAITIRSLGENRIDINIRVLIGRILYFFILALTIFWIFSVWSIALTIPVAFIGVVTVAITVSIQDVLKDLAAGFYILIERPFYIGNTISITSAAITYIGKVEDIQLRATKLRMISGEEVTIPNSLVFIGVVTNISYYGERRATIIVSLPQEEFISVETQEKILGCIKENEYVMPKPEPSILFTSYANKKVVLTLRFWIATEMPETISDIMHTLFTALPNAELEVKEFAGNI